MTESEIIQVVARLKKLNAKGREVKCEQDGIRAMLKQEFEKRGVNEVKAGRYVVKQIEYSRQQFDTKVFREQQPKVYELYCKPVTVKQIEIAG